MPSTQAAVIRKIATANETAQLALARIRARAAELTEKALDALELILDCEQKSPETYRRAAVNILSILGIPTAPIKSTTPADTLPDAAPESPDAPPAPAPVFPTLIEIADALEQVHLREPLTVKQRNQVLERLPRVSSDPRTALRNIHTDVLFTSQRKLFDDALAGDPLPPIPATQPTYPEDTSPLAPTPLNLTRPAPATATETSGPLPTAVIPCQSTHDLFFNINPTCQQIVETIPIVHRQLPFSPECLAEIELAYDKCNRYPRQILNYFENHFLLTTAQTQLFHDLLTKPPQKS